MCVRPSVCACVCVWFALVCAITCDPFKPDAPKFDQKWNHSHSIYHDDVIRWKHFPRYWPFVRGMHRSPVNSPHKGQWRGALMVSLICVWINGWVNNREAGDWRRYRAHYDVTVMCNVNHTGVETEIFRDNQSGQYQYCLCPCIPNHKVITKLWYWLRGRIGPCLPNGRILTSIAISVLRHS